MQKPAALDVLAALAVPLTIGCCLCRPNNLVAGPPEKYAVLASTEMATEDDVKYNSEFWYDLVLTYCTLIENGFEDKNIFVLYGDGNDYPSSFPRYAGSYCGDPLKTKITDIPLKNSTDIAKDNLCNVLCCLSAGHPADIAGGTCKCRSSGDVGIGGFTCSQYDIPRLSDDDFLVTWAKGHGVTSACETSLTFKSGYTLRDQEVKGLLTKLKPDRRVLFFETCDAGGWLGDFQNDDKTVVVISSGDPSKKSDCKETSWAATYGETEATTGAETEVIHGRFTFWVNAALRQLDLAGTPVGSDIDGNNLVSILEDYDAATQQIGDENSEFGQVLPIPNSADYGGVMHPAIKTPDGIAPCIFIRLATPGNDDDVFSMDHAEDDGTIPSVPTPTIPFDSPDLWVRHSEDGEKEHQPPKKGSDNYVYARVYNIGCADPSPTEVKFFFSPLSPLATCDDPTQWTEIGVDSINNLPVGDSHVFHATWEAGKMPIAGQYCLIGELSTPDDQPDDDAPVASDNNKAQIKIDVVD